MAMVRLLLVLLLPLFIDARVLEHRDGGPSSRTSVLRAETFFGKRQFPNMGMGGFGSGSILPGFMSPVAPSEVLSLTPRIRSTATRKRIMWGPFDFKGANETSTSPLASIPGIKMDPNGQVTMKRLSGFCTDCTVLHGTSYVANKDGSRVDVKDGAYLHHLLILNQGKRERSYYECSGSGANPVKQAIPLSYFLGSVANASEYFFTTRDGLYNSGYYIGKSDQFMMQNEIVNYHPEPQKWYIAADFEYIQGRPDGTEDVSVTDFNVNNCFGFVNAGYRPPSGITQFSKTSPKFIMSTDGTILYAMGHLHDGGVRIELLLNDKVVCDSVATYGGTQGTMKNEDGSKLESISSMSSCRDPIRVKKGDVMTMVSIYDTKLHPLRGSMDGEMMEEMGIYTIFFASKRRASSK